jgi:hypothetical protein
VACIGQERQTAGENAAKQEKSDYQAAPTGLPQDCGAVVGMSVVVMT